MLVSVSLPARVQPVPSGVNESVAKPSSDWQLWVLKSLLVNPRFLPSGVPALFLRSLGDCSLMRIHMTETTLGGSLEILVGLTAKWLQVKAPAAKCLVIAAQSLRSERWDGRKEPTRAIFYSDHTCVLARTHQAKKINVIKNKEILPTVSLNNLANSTPAFLDRDQPGCFHSKTASSRSWLGKRHRLYLNYKVRTFKLITEDINLKGFIRTFTTWRAGCWVLESIRLPLKS